MAYSPIHPLPHTSSFYGLDKSATEVRRAPKVEEGLCCLCGLQTALKTRAPVSLTHLIWTGHQEL